MDITTQKLASEQIKESELRYRELFEKANEGLIILSMEGKIVNANQAFADMHGFTLNEIKNMNIHELNVLKEKTFKTHSDIRERIHRGETVRFEVEHYHKDGHTIILSDTSSLINLDGEDFYLAFHQDISELKKNEKALKQASENWDKTFNAISDGVFILDMNQTVVECNVAYLNMIGKKREEVIGNTCYHCSHDSNCSISNCPFILMLHSKMRETIETTLFGMVFEVSIDPILDDNNVLIGGVHILKNIHEQKLAQQAIVESESKFRSIIECSPNPLALNDDEENITYVNPSFINTFGYTLEDIPTLSEWWKRVYPDPAYQKWVAQEWLSRLKQTKLTGIRFVPMEVKIRCKDDSYKYAVVGLSPLGSSFIDTHLVVFYDITDRKISEEALNQKINELERFQRLTVNRELKMIELKKEINELCVELGREKPHNVFE